MSSIPDLKIEDTYQISLPGSLVDKISSLATDLHVSKNQIVAFLIRRGLGDDKEFTKVLVRGLFTIDMIDENGIVK